MSTPQARFEITADDKTAAAFRSALSQGKKYSSDLTALFKGAGAGIAATFSVGAVITATRDAEKSLAQLEAAVKSTGGAAGFTAQQLSDISGELQKTTTFADDAIQSMQSVLLTFTNIKGQVFTDASQSVLDLSARMGTDLQSAAVQLGKALNDPISGLSGLTRVGVQFDDQQKELIKTLVESGRTMEAQELILDKLKTKFGGAAEAARNNFAGALEGLKNSVGDLLEMKSGLPALTSEINDLSAALSTDAAKGTADTIGAGLIAGIRAVGAVAGAVLEPISTLLVRVNDLGATLDNKIFGRQYTEAEFERIFGMSARSQGGNNPNSRKHVWADDEPAQDSGIDAVALKVSRTRLQHLIAMQEFEKNSDWLTQNGVALKEQSDKLAELTTIDATIDMEPIRDSLDEFGNLYSERFKSTAEEANKFAEQIRDSLYSSVHSAFMSIGQGSEQFATQLLNSFRSILSDAATSQLFEMMGSFGKSNSDSLWGSALSSLFTANAKGNAFGSSGLITAFANGGVVSGATPFAYAGGLGVMGEAGAEAIMPLSRGRDGKLGVKSEGSTGGMNFHAPLVQIDARGATQDAIKLLPQVAKTASDDAIARILQMKRQGKFQ